MPTPQPAKPTRQSKSSTKLRIVVTVAVVAILATTLGTGVIMLTGDATAPDSTPANAESSQGTENAQGTTGTPGTPGSSSPTTAIAPTTPTTVLDPGTVPAPPVVDAASACAAVDQAAIAQALASVNEILTNPSSGANEAEAQRLVAQVALVLYGQLMPAFDAFAAEDPAFAEVPVKARQVTAAVKVLLDKLAAGVPLADVLALPEAALSQQGLGRELDALVEAKLASVPECAAVVNQIGGNPSAGPVQGPELVP